MVALLALIIAFPQTSVSINIGSKGASVAVIAREPDSTRRDSTRRVPRRTPLVASAADLASAFRDASARSILDRARTARTGQDSSIHSYTGSTYQRLTIGMSFARIARDRIFFRHESSAKVRWLRGVGAQIDITGKRTVVPMLGGSGEVDMESMLSPVPYYPGRDALWMGLAAAQAVTDDDGLIHPLANGAEVYYSYRTGDSLSFRLPDSTTVQLRELEVRPRQVHSKLAVGSLWFDSATGQLVRAAYRMSMPFHFVESDTGSPPPFVVRAMRPTSVQITGVAIEYGHYQGRYWLPRSQVGEGEVRFGVMRMPMRIEERFSYEGVNGGLTLQAPLKPQRAELDSSTFAGLTGDERRRAVRGARDRADSVERATSCAATGSHTMRATRYGGALVVGVQIPCDSTALANSPDLPKSAFAATEGVFGDAERDALLEHAKSMMPEIVAARTRSSVDWGYDLLRYNRVEGLSSGIEIRPFGSPYLRIEPRIGVADRVINVDVALSRPGPERMTGLSLYRRLAAANDWGNPLSFGSSLSAFLFGRDEGMYFRTLGVELASERSDGAGWKWRAFHEQQDTATAHTQVSLLRLLGSTGFRPAANISADHAAQSGLALHRVSSFGLDPNGFRLMADLRLEGGVGDFDYARGALDLTLSHPLVAGLSTSVTAGGGSSGGTLPVQRLWYLGGTASVRGQSAGAMAGDSYWLTRTEIGGGSPGLRKVLFADVGWAGSRRDWRSVGRPASGVGAAISFMDGAMRFDVARGIFPSRQWRVAMYLEGKY
jgi:hypothetical protein